MLHLSAKSLLVLPNHCINMARSRPVIEAAEVSLLQQVSKAFGEVGVAAFFARYSDTNVSAAVSDADARIYILSPWDHNKRLSRKVLNYTVATVRLDALLRKFDALYLFCPSPIAKVAAHLAMRNRQPYALYVRGTWLDGRGETPTIWKRIFRGASFIIATGHAFQTRLRRFNRNVIVEVPLTQVKFPTKQRENRRLDGVETLKLLYAGRVTERKGVFDVIRAMSVLNSKHRGRYRLLIAGGGLPDSIAQLKGLIEEHSLSEAVEFAGYLAPPELMDALAGADIFVYPSYYPEGFPRVIHEAMMYGLPIVTCSMPGAERYLIDNVNCLTARAGDYYDIAQCIVRLADDPDLAEALGENAYRLVSNTFADFSCASHGEQLIEAFTNVLRPDSSALYR